MPAESRLPFALPKSDLPLHERLADAIEQAVSSGAMGLGDRLPTHREISTHFGVAIGTVTKAIDSLSRRGIVRGEVGRGTFVQSSAPVAVELLDLTINAPLPVIKPEIMYAAAERAARVSLEMPNGGYVDLTGTAQQRATVAEWLSSTRLKCGPEDLVLSVGAQHGIHLAFAELKQLSPTIVSELHTFPGAIAAAANLGMPMHGVEYDDQGMIPNALDAALKALGAKIVYTTPVCQNPLSLEMGEDRRRDILAVCAKHEAYLVEDDIYGFYSENRAPTFKELAPDRVFYLTSLSKCLTPLVRLGAIIPPSGIRQAIAKRMRAEVWGGSPIALNIACALLDLGAYEAATAALRSESQQRLQLARSILGDSLPDLDRLSPHIWLPMSMLEAERLARRASEKNVRLTSPSASALGSEAPGGVRL
ncbi:MAG TPA: PLP-dependent aminotransferase family protein, partial [Pseudorhizobium sp.]|nr:PLP-dependent aminotransferase family protein [Pseudorhizobium sp.]